DEANAAPADGAGQAGPDAGSVAEAAGDPGGPEMAPSAVAEHAGGLEQFRETVQYLNGRALQVAGVDLFTEVEAVAGDTVQVGTTAAWASMPAAGQESYLNTLLDRWLAARGGGPASVRIVDPGGRVVLEKSRP
ncbi:MAG: hypothetical protein ACREH3_01845, partial [Geminicoccales bacterium]